MPTKRDEYIALIKKELPEKRFRHSLGVEKAAVELARRYGEDEEKAGTAGLLHDLAKKKKGKAALAENYNIEIDDVERLMPDLLHGPLAAEIMERELGITDQDVLNAARYHTTGRPGMSKLEKIIWFADLVEENRDFPGVEDLRRLGREDLDKAVLAGMAHVLKYLIDTKTPVCPKSVEAYNYMVIKKEGTD